MKKVFLYLFLGYALLISWKIFLDEWLSRFFKYSKSIWEKLYYLSVFYFLISILILFIFRFILLGNKNSKIKFKSWQKWAIIFFIFALLQTLFFFFQDFSSFSSWSLKDIIEAFLNIFTFINLFPTLLPDYLINVFNINVNYSTQSIITFIFVMIFNIFYWIVLWLLHDKIKSFFKYKKTALFIFYLWIFLIHISFIFYFIYSYID